MRLGHLHSSSQRGEGDRGQDRVSTAARGLDHQVRGAVHPVNIVARSAGHGVNASAIVQGVIAGATQQRIVAGQTEQLVIAVKAAQDVGSGVAGQDVVQDVARQIEGRRALEDGVLHVGSQAGQHDAGVDSVDPTVETLDHDVQRAVHAVDIVASAAVERVIAVVSLQAVVARIAQQAIVACQAHDHVGARAAVDRVIPCRSRVVHGAFR